MVKIGLIPFQFEVAAPESISENLWNFYLYTAKTVFEEECEISFPKERINLSVSHHEVKLEDSITYIKIREYAETWIGEVDYIIVDIIEHIRGILPGKQYLHLATALISFLSGPSPDKLKSILILAPQLPPEEESFRSILKPYIDSGQIIMIDNSGNLLTCGDYPTRFSSDSHIMKRLEAYENPIDLLQVKMIKRLGHFKKPSFGNVNECMRVYFDGTECDKELSQLIGKYVQDTYGEDSKPIILYHSPISDWLKEPIFAFSTSLGTESISVDEFVEKKGELHSDLSIPPLLILPLIDTGKTLLEVYKRLKKIGKTPSPKILAILSTQGEKNKTYTIKIKAEDVILDIFYLLKVNKTIYKKEHCPLCRYNIPFSDYTRDDFVMFTAYDMWEMANEAGWIKEKDVPFVRKGYKLVPYFAEMSRQNGAWLACKVRDRLTYSLLDFPAEPITVVCPDEEGANALASFLRVMRGFTLIQVPKEALDACRPNRIDSKKIVNEWEKQAETWFLRLKSVSPTQGIIILEEFSASGNTRRALYRLVELCRKEILCHFSLVNFNPKEPNFKEVPSYSLYEFQMFNLEQLKKGSRAE